MEFTGVYHKTSEQMSYAGNQRELIVNIKTGYDVRRVFIHYGDPFEAGILGGKEKWTGKREEIRSYRRLKYQLWWTITLVPAYKRCKYYFELQTDTETWYYFEDGFLTKEQLGMEGRMLQYFIVPWMNPADVSQTPGWVSETVWYQIFPDRFCNGTPERNAEGILPWRTGPVDKRDRFGGNLEGIRQRLKQMKPDIYLLGEIWHDASQWLLGDEYDSVMNYPLMSGILDFFIDQERNKQDFEFAINRCYTMYMQQCNEVLFNLLDSHDTERLMNRFHNLDVFFQQLAILFTMPGSPCIYYGTEIAMEGGHDPDCRRCMPWEELETGENRERIRQMQKLIAMRRQESSCRSLSYEFTSRYAEPRCIEYIKTDGNGKKVEVLLNCGETAVRTGEEGDVLFSRNYQDGYLHKNGTLIRKTAE